MLSVLPVEIWTMIFLYLSSRDIAAFILCFPELQTVILKKYFRKHFLKRFARIECCSVLNRLREECVRYNFPLLQLWSGWCQTKHFLHSGHCVACLTHPYLLLYSPFRSGCNCVDHRNLWYNLQDVVLWTCSSWQDLSPGWRWPECGVPVRAVKSVKKT